ncbi:MAG: (d)CMP kinase [Alphaproteobacteria bacterium]|nr:(d)CMP kinase [Alphaproteobacteria bacterium]
MVIAIDGPAASGKGTLARAIAQELGFAHMDTGALYRASAYELIKAGMSARDKTDALKAAQILVKKIKAADMPDDILGKPSLREDRIGQKASIIAAYPKVREALNILQQDFAASPPRPYKGAVLDGRDIGTVICPDADVKIFVTADDEVRAQRRTKELQSRGLDVTYEAVLKDMRERDARDTARTAAPMKQAPDAYVLDTSALTQAEMLSQALEIIREKVQI